MMPHPGPSPLALRLAERIRREGPLDFAEFMAACLHDPDHGYYAAGPSPFGAEGDFVTAPELGRLFARALARLVAPTLRSLAEPVLRELGPGSGALAAVLLPALAERGALPVCYELVEPAPARRREQQARIAPLAAELGVRLRWSERAETAGEGVVLANEVLDALPVRRVLLAGRGILALAVGLDERGAFRWEPRPAEAALAAEVEALLRRLPAPLPRPYVLELRPGLGDFLASALAGLERGAALFVDYGYPRHEFYLPERRMGTLVAHRGHRPVANPLAEPGRIDLGGFVDFTALAEALAGLGWTPSAYLSQAELLLAAGLLEELAALPPASPGYFAAAAEARRLLLPGEMGERFRALAACRGLPEAFAPLGRGRGLERLYPPEPPA